ncbi:GtrA family protein [Candidatus Pelagibacter sp.]|uniref:GtrA family protein n=1 Tax=Candidatus Pelagibacter sp. TaxID=2024849 RepID=UPI003F86FA02
MEKKLFKLLTRYFFIGILAAFIELSSFSLFIKHINYIIANSLAFCLAVITSFVLNRVFNFKVHDKTIIRFGRFLIVNIGGLCISNFILFYLRGFMPYIELKILSMPVVIFFQFVTNYLWTFKK